VVVDGQVEIFSRNGQRETTIAVLTRNESFILAAVLTDRPYLKSARALTSARILMMPAELVRRTVADDAGFAHALMIELARSYRNLVKELKNQKLRSSLERLAAWILRTDAELGQAGRFELPYEKRVLAARIGVAPEVLSRSFASLVAYKVTVAGKSVTIGDREALAKLASPNPLIDDPYV
jgi:CRP/FNR family transcriptional regulator, transcriptional activator FtrB